MRRHSSLALGTLAGCVLGLVGATPASAATTYHVATTGSDANTGTSTRPLRSVQKAVDLASAGSTILVHAGTYTGQVKVRKSGTASAPITLTTAGDGPVTLTSSPAAVSCGSRQPAPDRTVMITGGADHWTVKGFTIVNGVHVYGKESNTAYRYFTDLVNAGNWKTRRSLPGRGTDDPAAARTLVDALRSRTGKPLDRAEGISILDNTITRRGIHASFTGYGTISGNTIRDIDCGTGPGVWLITYSDGWTVSKNTVRNVARSTAAHFMQEGIRLGSASNYNRVQDNVVEDLPGDGRAFNTDVDSSYNDFERNTARRVAVGYNDQMSGWGNVWRSNRVEDHRDYGFSFRLMDGSLAAPSDHSSTTGAVVSCNTARGTGKDLGVGGSQGSTFTGNSFATGFVSRNAQRYWGAEGNRYNGSTTAPSGTLKVSTTGC